MTQLWRHMYIGSTLYEGQNKSYTVMTSYKIYRKHSIWRSKIICVIHISLLWRQTYIGSTLYDVTIKTYHIFTTSYIIHSELLFTSIKNISHRYDVIHISPLWCHAYIVNALYISQKHITPLWHHTYHTVMTSYMHSILSPKHPL